MADRTAKDIIAELNGLEGDERKEALKLLQNDQGDVVRSARDKIAGAARKDGAKTLSEVREQAENAETLDDVLKIAQAVGVPEEKLEAVRKKVPDRATLETEIKGQFGTQVDKLTKRNQTLEGENLTLRRGKHTKKLVELLHKNHKVDPEYADEVLVAKHQDRIAPVKDKPGEFDVLQPDGKTPYEGESIDEKLTHMAADIAEKVNPRYVLTNVDRGAGIRNGDGAGTGGTLTQEQLVEKKRSSSVFRGAGV